MFLILKMKVNQDISTSDERIINPELKQFYDENKYEFVPGFQYIDKNKFD